MTAKDLRKSVWIAFGTGAMAITVVAEFGEYLTGIHINMILRISIVLGLTLGMWVLAGTWMLINNLGEERSLSGYSKVTQNKEAGAKQQEDSGIGSDA
jgi:hypothetical protein